MMTYLIFGADPWLLVILMVVILSLSIELPYRWGQSLVANAVKNMDAFGAVQAGLLTLASFVLGLSFSQAEARFDSRRALVIKEANAIGTTWLRADQLDAAQTKRFRSVLVDYTTIRLQGYLSAIGAAGTQRDLVATVVDRSNADQSTMWAITSSALRAHPSNLGISLLMQSLNDTIDVSAEQLQALTTHIPTSVVDLTLLLVALGALSLGIRFAADRSRPATLSVIYVVAAVVVITMMIDYDRPQSGFVRVNLNPIKVQLAQMQAAQR